jgi:hypothetical protein
LELKSKYENLIKKSENYVLKKGGKKYWRIVVKSIMAVLKLFREGITNRLKSRTS